MALPVLLLAAWALGDPSTMLQHAGGPSLPVEPALWQVVIAAALSSSSALMVSAALLAARRCFLALARDCAPTPAAAAGLRGFGLWIALAGCTGLVLPTLLGLVLSLDAPAGQRMLVIAIGSTPVLGMVFGFMVWAIGEVMARAAAMAEELAQIV